MSHLRRSVLGGRSNKKFRSGPTDYHPVKWSKYFDKHESVEINDGVFHYYTKGHTGPLLVAIHGGGYSALTWALFAQEITTKIECRILAVDLRGHGNTNTENDSELSLEQLSTDVIDLLNCVFQEALPPTILIGHSMGGAVAVEVAQTLTSLVGLCVIDVVEGTALDALSSMQSILRGRPASFKSIDQAIQWGYRGGTTQNIDAARVSMPGQIKNKETGILASEEVENMTQEELDSLSAKCSSQIIKLKPADSIDEENEDGDMSPTNSGGPAHKPPLPVKAQEKESAISLPSSPGSSQYEWRIDLTKTEKFWSGWFKGLSQKFLDVNSPKILLLANISGLDTSLTVGQMQGKFQLQVLSRSGHAIHEDQPEHVADIIATYLARQKLAKTLQGFVPMLPGC